MHSFYINRSQFCFFFVNFNKFELKSLIAIFISHSIDSIRFLSHKQIKILRFQSFSLCLRSIDCYCYWFGWIFLSLSPSSHYAYDITSTVKCLIIVLNVQGSIGFDVKKSKTFRIYFFFSLFVNTVMFLLVFTKENWHCPIANGINVVLSHV